MSVNASAFDPFKEPFDDLDHFADRISDVLKCPITIEDVNHRLIAYSTHDDRTDPARIATIIGRRVPEKVINSLWKHGVIPSLINSEEPIRIKKIDEIGLGHRAAISIQHNKEILGYIWALEIDRSLDNEDLTLLKKAAKAAKNHLLQLQSRKHKKEKGQQEFFWQLLTGHLKSGDEMQKKFDAMQISPPSLISVIVFRFANEIDTKIENQIAYMLKTTQSIRIIFHTIDYKDLILLTSPLSLQPVMKDLNHFIDSFISQMDERFNIKMMNGGCGSLYEGCEKVEKSFKEALTVLDMKEKFTEETHSIYSYQELGIYQYLDVIFEKRYSEDFENLALKKLKAYDKQHNSQLLETLEVYLHKDNNINDAAKALHIHVNTLNYRLKRIAEIGEIDFKDPNQKITLYIDLKVEKYKKTRGLL